MRLRLNLSIVTFFWLLSHHLAAFQILNDSIHAQLELGVKGFQERYHSPSLVLAIVHGDELIFSNAQGFTDLENKTPATIDSKYQIQSITKMFTATMFMQLVEQGTVAMYDELKLYVPEYSGTKNQQFADSITKKNKGQYNLHLRKNSSDLCSL